MERSQHPPRNWMHRIRSEVLALFLFAFFLVTIMHTYSYLFYIPRSEASVSFTFYQTNVSAPTIGAVSIHHDAAHIKTQIPVKDDVKEKEEETVSSTVVEGVIDRPKVALMFLSRGRLHNEPTWRVFFEAAGRLKLRFDSLAHKNESYVYGSGKAFFKRVNGNITRRLLGDTPPARCSGRKELKYIVSELNRVRLDHQGASRVIGNQDLFSVYTHPSARYKFPEKSIFYGTEVKGRVNTFDAWGKFGLMAAELQLMRMALLDERNQKFVMLSESCLPLHRPEVIYLQLMAETKSRVNACGAFQERNKLKRWDNSMLSEYLSPVNWRFSSQWVALKRSHVELISKDDHVRQRFKKFCSIQSERKCVPDEHYIPTVLSVYGVTQETDCIGQVTALRRLVENRAHAVSFSRWNINATLFNSLKNVEACKTVAVQVSTRRVFDDGHRGERCIKSKSNASEAVELRPELAEWVRRSGFKPMPYECSLFARKFTIRSIWTAARTALSCEGGGLGYWC